MYIHVYTLLWSNLTYQIVQTFIHISAHLHAWGKLLDDDDWSMENAKQQWMMMIWMWVKMEDLGDHKC